MQHRTRTLLAVLALALASQACTLAMMRRMGKPRTAEPVTTEASTEASAALRSARFAAPPPGMHVATFAASPSWQDRPDGEGRFLDYTMFYREPARGLLRPAPGENTVCFEYPCRLSQAVVSGGGYGEGVLECNEAMAHKVTCASVDAQPRELAIQ